jgi:hypothetical protein
LKEAILDDIKAVDTTCSPLAPGENGLGESRDPIPDGRVVDDTDLGEHRFPHPRAVQPLFIEREPHERIRGVGADPDALFGDLHDLIDQRTALPLG